MLQPKKPVVKKTTKKKSINPADSYPDKKDKRGFPLIGGGEGTRPPFTAEERKKMPRVGSMGSGKNGKTIKKAKSGTSLGMKSVKSGYDKNPGVTRADIITAATKKAQRGARVKKKTGMDAVKALGKHISTFGGATERDNPKQKDINIVKKLKETGNKVKNKLGLKSGGSVKKCKYGCK